MKYKLETLKEEKQRIEEQRQSIAKYKSEPKVASSGSFFSFKVITLKDLQERNNQPLRNKL